MTVDAVESVTYQAGNMLFETLTDEVGKVQVMPLCMLV